LRQAASPRANAAKSATTQADLREALRIINIGSALNQAWQKQRKLSKPIPKKPLNFIKTSLTEKTDFNLFQKIKRP